MRGALGLLEPVGVDQGPEASHGGCEFAIELIDGRCPGVVIIGICSATEQLREIFCHASQGVRSLVEGPAWIEPLGGSAR